jgi:hypothetical protein
MWVFSGTSISSIPIKEEAYTNVYTATNWYKEYFAETIRRVPLMRTRVI